jgi:hypothetical protein
MRSTSASAGLLALMAACCVVGPAALAAAVGAAAGSLFGLVGAITLALACIGALLVWRHKGRKAC